MVLPKSGTLRHPKKSKSPISLWKRMIIFSVSIVIVLKLCIQLFGSASSSSDKNTNPLIHVSRGGFSGETITLRSGYKMPSIGIGTCCRPTAKGPDIYKSIVTFLHHGGRLIDTAMAYDNHLDIGRAVRDSGLRRDEIWITSKIAVGRMKGKGPAGTVQAVRDILSELGTNYLDLCLVHSPKMGRKETIQIWTGLIQSKEEGLIRSIGVSNFNRHEMEDLHEATGAMPELNQIQFHPWIEQEWREVVRWQQKNGIATTAYTSLGGARFRRPRKNRGQKDGTTTSVSILPPSAEGVTEGGAPVTEAQVLLRWALRQGVAVIPGATSEAHILENLRVPPMLDRTDAYFEELERREAPAGWFDSKRGPNKFSGEAANAAWGGKR